MIFNGHTHESIAALDDVTMLQIQTMYADGVIGNHKLIEVISSLTTGIFNYIRPQGAPAITLAKIIGSSYDYLYPPLPPEEQKKAVSNSLIAFMTQSPGYKAGTLKANQNG